MATNDTTIGCNRDSDKEKRKYNRKKTDMAPSSLRKTTGFEIQTRDIRNPTTRAFIVKSHFDIQLDNSQLWK